MNKNSTETSKVKLETSKKKKKNETEVFGVEKKSRLSPPPSLSLNPKKELVNYTVKKTQRYTAPHTNSAAMFWRKDLTAEQKWKLPQYKRDFHIKTEKGLKQPKRKSSAHISNSINTARRKRNTFWFNRECKNKSALGPKLDYEFTEWAKSSVLVKIYITFFNSLIEGRKENKGRMMLMKEGQLLL